LPTSPSFASSISVDGPSNVSQDPLSSFGYNLPNPKPLWLNPAHAKHIVKGNFMTLAARPKTVELGEWLAHQGVIS